MDEEDAFFIFKSILAKASSRIAKEDTYGLFEDPVEYVICFNNICEDVASKDYNLSSADYQNMIYQHKLSSKT